MPRILIPFALAAAIAAPATAQNGDAAKPISKSEVSAQLDSDYADLDADKDGMVGADEINARLLKGAEAELAEISKKRDDAFARFDSDGDGTISRAEFDAQAKIPELAKPDPAPFLARFDADKDGTITAEEFRAPTLANFAKLDVNKDGTLSVTEQKAPLPNKAGPPKPKETPPIGR